MPDPFFTTGGTLASDSPSYVERQADRELYDNLLRGEYCYVLTPRQMGKSSLMVRTGLRLRREGIRVVLLDLTSLGQNMTPDQWYEGLAEVIGEQLGLEEAVLEYWQERAALPPLRRWMSLLKDVLLAPPSGGETPMPLILFVDEIDAVLSLPFSTDEFFAAIRECYNRRSSQPVFRELTFCLLGVATPSDLIRDVRTTPFNIGQRIELTDFTPAEARPLAHGMLRSTTGESTTPAAGLERRAERLLARVLHWTGGHPYLTQRLCRTVIEASAPAALAPAAVDAACHSLFLTARGWERDDNLLFVRDRLLRTGSDLVPVLELLKRIRAGRRVTQEETNPVLDLLRLSGVIRSSAPGYEIRNRIYARVFDQAWIRSNIPQTEVQRQRAAFLRGATRASALAAVIFTLMLLLTLTALDRARVAREARDTLGSSLRKQVVLNKELAISLAETRQSREKASRAVTAALAAGKSEFEQRKRAESARSAMQVAVRHTEQARREVVDRLSRSCIDATTRAVGRGDLLGALPPLADALKLDAGNPEREPIHRIRLAALLRESPHLREMWNAGADVTALAISPDGELVAAASEEGAVRLFDHGGRRPARDLTRGAGNVTSLVFSPDGSLLAAVDHAGSARVWDTRSGRAISAPLSGLGKLRFAAWHRSGTRLAVGGDNGVVIWEVRPTRKVREIVFPRAGGCRPVFSPDGRKLAIVAGNHLGWIADTESGEIRFNLARCFNGTWVEFSPDGATLLVGGSFGNPIVHQGAAIVDAATGTALRFLEMPDLALAARLSRDGTRAVVGDRLGNVRVWDTRSGAPLSPLIHLEQEVSTVSFSPDGKAVLATSRDGMATIRDAVTGAPLCTPLRHGSWINGAAFSGDGRTVWTASHDGAARAWQLPDPEPRFPAAELAFGLPTAEETIAQLDHLAGDRWAVGRLRAGGNPSAETVRVWNSRNGRLQAPGRWRRYAVSPDRRWLALAGEGGVQLWDAASGRAVTPLRPVDFSRADLTLQPGGRWLAARETGAPHEGQLRALDLRTGQLVTPTPEPVIQVYGFPDQGRSLVFTAGDHNTKLWRVPSGVSKPGPVHPLPGVRNSAIVQIAPGGGSLVTITDGNVFRAWSGGGHPFSPERKFDIAHFWAPGQGISFSDDGRRAVAFALVSHGKRDHSAGTLFDLAAPADRLLPGGEQMPLYYSAAFSPQGDRFATFSNAGDLRVWDARTGEPVTALLHHGTVLHYLSFSRDGRRLVSAAMDGTARVWDAATGRPVTPFLPHPGPVLWASFSPDGRLVLTLAKDRTTRVWDARTGEGVVLPLDAELPVDDCRFLPDSRRVLSHCGPRTVIHNLFPDPRPLPELTRLCLLLAAHRADGNGGLQALEPDQLRAAWQPQQNRDR